MLTASASRFHPARVVLPIDFRPSSDVAFGAAADLAVCFEGELYVVHALLMPPVRTGIKYLSAFFPQQEFLREVEVGAESRL